MTRANQLDDRELLDLLLQEEGVDRSPALGVRPDRSAPPCLSRAQLRLWSLYHTAPDSPAYNISSAVRMTGPLDVAALESSLNEVVRRHEALRSCFPADDGRPTVMLRDKLVLEIPLDDHGELPEDKQQEAIEQSCFVEGRRPFDIESGPLLRVRLLRLAEQDHVVTLTMHHIISDGWSMGVFLGELNEFYRSFTAGRPSSLPELTLQYSDFARWQQEWLQQEEAAAQRLWWCEQLAGLTPLALPIGRARPPEPSFQGDVHVSPIPAALAADLKAIGSEEGATPYVTLLAAFAVLLHRYSGQDDVVVGSPVANRNRREIEPLIGFFVNSLVMRCDVSRRPSFRTVLRRVRDFAMEGLARQDYPFDELVKALAPDRDTTGNPLFQVMFSFENAPSGKLELPDLQLAPVGVATRIAKFDLLLNISESADGLTAAFEYSTDLYDADVMRQMADSFVTLLESIVAAPDEAVAALPLLNDEEQQRLLVEWNQTDSAFPRDTCIHELFEEEVRQDPDRVAVEFFRQQLSYGELNARANQLAHHLRDLGVGPDTLVAMCVERSVEMVVAVLGILKAGGAYVPLDPEDPAERLAFLLDEIAPPVLLTQEHLADQLPQTGSTVLRLDSGWPQIAGLPQDNLPTRVPVESLAYVLFTSGSTGTPKGVCVGHRSVVRLVKETDFAKFGADEVFLQLAPLPFDASTLEIWGPLLNGGRLAVAPPHMPSLEEIGQYVARHQVTTLWLTAGLFHLMVDERLDDLRPLRQLLVGGDVLSVPHVTRAVRELANCQLINGYGPTENTTFTCCHPIREADLNRPSIPIGRPIANTRVYILDGELQPTPIGVPGELCISGEGLARGYHHRQDLTNEQFIENPIAGDPGVRIYKTGDLCRWLPEGTIEFLGRRDQQIKIRGFRIELGEIESTLVSYPAVRDAVVTSHKEPAGKHFLAAYVTPDSTVPLDSEDLRFYLESKLPSYMVPAHFMVLDELPLNANGKVDRAKLPAPELGAAASDGDLQPPRDEREECLTSIWQDVLRCEGVGIHDNYFELGGDSITAIQLVSRLKRAGWQVQVAELFRQPTIAQLAPFLKPEEAVEEAAQEVGEIPLTAIQHWFFEHHPSHRDHFNLAVTLRANERLDETRLQQALTRLEARHDALRLTFPEQDGVPAQVGVAASEQASLEVIDLRESENELAAMTDHANRLQKSIELLQGPIMKAALFRCCDKDRLLLVIHHLAVDGVSWRILLEDLQLAYHDLDLGAPTSSFRGWAEQVQRLAAEDDLRAELDYWAAVEQLEVSPLPIDDTGSTNRHGDTMTVREVLSEADTQWLLTGAHRAHRTEIMDLLLTALGRALSAWTGRADTLITLEGHGRELHGNLDLTRTVGWFTSLYPFTLSVAGDDIGQQVRRLKEDLRRVPNKGAGYGVLRYVAGQPLTSEPKISFNYLGKFEDAGAREGLFEFADDPKGDEFDGRLQRSHELDFVGVVGQGCFELSLVFNPQRLSREDASDLLRDVKQQLYLVGEHCRRLIQSDGVGESLGVVADDATVNSTDPWREAVAGIAEGRIEDVYPLSPMQQGLLFQALYEPDDDAYCVQSTHRIEGPLRADIFEESWQLLAQRHAVLRSAFIHEGPEEPLQAVLENRPPEFQHLDLRELSVAEADDRIERFRARERHRGFDLQHDVLMRLALFQREDEVHELVWTYHHVLLDGWCMGILYPELIEAYSALRRGRTPDLPAVVPYRSYIDWLGERDFDQAREFWAAYAAGYHGTATLPKRHTESTEPEIQKEHLRLAPEQTDELRRLAASCGVTLNTIVQTLWGLLLCRYNDVDDVVFGAIVSGRPSELDHVERVVGVFINAVPVRIRCDAGQSLIELLQSVQQSALDSQPYSYVPLAEIQAAAGSGRELFDHLLICENYPRSFSEPDDGPDEDALNFELVDACDFTHYDFAITVDIGEALEFRFEYRPSVYPAALIRRFGEHVTAAVERIIDNPQRPAASIVVVPESDLGAADCQPLRPEEAAELLSLGAGPRETYPFDCTIAELFQRQAAESPDRIAAVHNARQITYRDLNVRANRIAHELGRLGVEHGDIVGILDERGIDFLASMLGVLKAGAAFLPLDPAYPPDRIRYMLENSQARTLITRTSLNSASGQAACLDLDSEGLAASESSDPELACSPEDTAYVLYTSGSTGLPKGAMVRHDGAVNHIFAEFDLLAFHGDTRFLQSAPASSDISVWQFLAPVLIGGRTVVADYETVCDPAQLFNTIRSAGVTLIEVVPAVMIALLEHVRTLPSAERELPSLDWAMITGEAAPVPVVNQWLESFPAVPLANAYGPTEVADDICQHALNRPLPAGCRSVPIGRPLANLTLYVLDEELRLVPRGAAGEICVAGVGVGAGYVNDPARTDESFVPNPFAGPDHGDMLYRTGDLGRWLEDGTLEYLDRRDHQVKVRGYRIELGEIEAVLSAHPRVRQAVTLVQGDGPAEKQLVAYVVPTTEESAIPLGDMELREHLQQRLPEHMVPSAFVFLESLPLTPSGKIDRAELSALESTSGCPHVPPRNRLEERLAEIWQSILRTEDFGVADNFFALGGHSLKAMQVVAQVRRQLEVELSLRQVFETPTIAGLAAAVEAAEQLAYAAIAPCPRQEHYDLSHAQHRLWLQHHLEDEASYSMPTAFIFEGVPEVEALNQAFTSLIARHEMLRTAFVLVDGEPRQKILPEIEFRIDEIDLRERADAEEVARDYVNGLIHTPFDLARPPLLKAAVLRLAERRFVFVLNMHHIIGDGWSDSILFQETLTLYEAYRNGRPNPLGPLRIQYKDYAAWQNAQGFQREQEYWLRQLANVPEGISLPCDSPAEDRDARQNVEKLVLTEDTTTALREFAAAQGTTVSIIGLALYKLLLFQWTRQSDLCVGMSVANRNHPDVEPLIGFFVNIIPLRSQVSAEMEFADLLQQVQSNCHAALEHQEYPFDLLIHKLNPTRTDEGKSIVNVIYAYQNFSDVAPVVDDLAADPATSSDSDNEPISWKPFAHSFPASKFDLNLIVIDEDEEIQLLMQYDVQLFHAATIQRLLHSLKQFANMITQPSEVPQ